MVDGINRVESFEQLQVWQRAVDLAVAVYKATENFPKHEQFALTNQMRRASTSISANIAEGFGRQSKKEKIQFYSIAYGSLLEVKSFLYLGDKLKYVKKDDLDFILGFSLSLQKQINALIRSIKNNG